MRKIVLFVCFLLLSTDCFASGETTVDGHISESHIIQNDGTTVSQQPILNFKSGLQAINSGSKTEISADLTTLGNTFLNLNQSTPQDIINGQPDFLAGLRRFY